MFKYWYIHGKYKINDKASKQNICRNHVIKLKEIYNGKDKYYGVWCTSYFALLKMFVP